MLHDGVRYCENGRQPCGSEIKPLQCNSWHHTPSEKSSSKWRVVQAMKHPAELRKCSPFGRGSRARWWGGRRGTQEATGSYPLCLHCCRQGAMEDQQMRTLVLYFCFLQPIVKTIMTCAPRLLKIEQMHCLNLL